MAIGTLLKPALLLTALVPWQMGGCIDIDIEQPSQEPTNTPGTTGSADTPTPTVSTTPDDTDYICIGVEPSEAGQVVRYSQTGCTEYQPGTLPLVISMPHGGYLIPSEFPDRTQGTTVNDGVTQELGREVADAIEALVGERPFVVINRLDRLKLDPNRDVDEAAEGAAIAEAEWAAYHGFIESALEDIRVSGQLGFYVDLHGQSHDPGRTQLGFSTTADNLELSDQALNSGGYAEWSSLLPHVEASGAPFTEVLRGQSSLGGRLEAAGFSVVPSPASPSPGGNVTYWNTGFSSYTHGPLQGATWMSSVLFETAYEGVRDTPRHRKAFAEALAEALLGFQTDYGSLQRRR